MAKQPKHSGEPRYRATIYGHNGEKYYRPSYPQFSEAAEMRYLKNLVRNWKKYTVKLAYIYDQRYTDSGGDTILLSRYENGEFIGA